VSVQETTRADGAGVSFAGYADEERPLPAYAALSGTFGGGLAIAIVALARSERLPERVETRDLALAGIATHKLSRLITKDKVTSFMRAPFTRYQEPAGHGELEEAARGKGIQRALGELLSCPYCVAQWIAAGFTIGLVTSPRVTRLVAGIYVAETISDFLQAAYRAAEERT
jgi:alkylhydroperoxidase family enzyme